MAYVAPTPVAKKVTWYRVSFQRGTGPLAETLIQLIMTNVSSDLSSKGRRVDCRRFVRNHYTYGCGISDNETHAALQQRLREEDRYTGMANINAPQASELE